VFGLREEKLAAFQRIRESFPYTEIYKMHEFMDEPDLYMAKLAAKYALKVVAYPKKVSMEKKYTSVCYNQRELEIAKASLNWAQESRWGYQPSDCHLCPGS
jgi:hypothetical protein